MRVLSRRFRASVVLRQIDIEISNSAIERIHRAIEAEIDRGSKRLENAAKKGNPDMLDSLIDDECEEIEELLGIAFVAGQSFINRIRSRLSALDRVCLADFGERLGFFAAGNSMNDLLRRGRTVTTTPFSTSEVVNGVANYWKHSDEWTTCESVKGSRFVQVWDISVMSNLQKGTAELVSALGLCPGSSGNLRDAANALGIEKFQDLRPMRKELTLWAKDVYEMAGEDLKTLISRIPREELEAEERDLEDPEP
jgi:hypothetical protein